MLYCEIFATAADGTTEPKRMREEGGGRRKEGRRERSACIICDFIWTIKKRVDAMMKLPDEEGKKTRRKRWRRQRRQRRRRRRA